MVSVSRRNFMKTAAGTAVALSAGCGFKTPLQPTSSGGSLRDLWMQAGAAIGVHPFDNHKSDSDATGQLYHLARMIDAGVLKNVRLEYLHPGAADTYARYLSQRGVEVLGIFPDEHLRSPNVLETLDSMIRMHPYIQHWDVGNEVANSGFMGGPAMDAEEYMGSSANPGVFRRIFDYCKTNHPDIKLVTQSDFLGAMVEQGLGELIRERPYHTIIGTHPYHHLSTNFAEETKYQLAKVADQAGVKPRVWATETGIQDWGRHIDFLNTHYPSYINSLGAEKIFWYVFSECGDFSLVKGLPGQCGESVEYSPILKELVGDVK